MSTFNMKQTIVLDKPKVSRLIQAVGLLLFGFLFYMAWHFYRERMLTFDGAFYIFRMMESGKMAYGPARYSDGIIEILPLWFFKMGFSLPTIIRAYSVMFIVFHYLIFLIVTLWLRNNGAGIAIMMASCITYYSAYYLPMMELHEVIILGVLLWAIIHPETPNFSNRYRLWSTIGALLTIVCMSFFHPLGLIVIAYVIGMEIIGSRRYRDMQLWFIAIVGLAWFLFKIDYLFKQQYDQDQVMPLHSMLSNLSAWKTWPSTQFLSDFTRYHFRSIKWLAIICTILSLRKGLLTFIFFSCSLAGYTFILISNFRTGASSFLFENYYIMYGFLVGLMFVFLFYHPRRMNLILFIALPFLWTGAKRIYEAHTDFSDRVAYLGRIVDAAHKQGGKKYFIDSKCFPVNYAMADWDLAFETLLYSSLQGPDSTVTIYSKDAATSHICDSAQNGKNIMFSVHFCPMWFTSNDMPDKYFRLPSTGYDYLTHSQNDTAFHEENFSAGSFKIIPLVSEVHAKFHKWTVQIPIRIENNSGKVIPAIPGDKDPVELSYHLYMADGEVVDGYLPTAFETDMKQNEVMALTVYPPMAGGTYYIKPDIITKGKRWWNIDTPKVKVIID